MNNFNFIKTDIDGLIIIETKSFVDNRGYFMKTYEERQFANGGITSKFVQENQSKSTKGVLRGMHMQGKHPQAKLVRVIKGEVYDVAVDLRKSSLTYGKYVGVTLSAENGRQLFIPKGFAHGFLVLSDCAEFVYKCDDFYHPEDEVAFIWNDPMVSIKWPLEGKTPILSEKDARLPKFKELKLY